jgi:hypothetical protein
MHSSAKFYGSRDNMTTLLVKISNQIIKSCRIWINTIPADQQAKEVKDEALNKKPSIYDR